MALTQEALSLPFFLFYFLSSSLQASINLLYFEISILFSSGSESSMLSVIRWREACLPSTTVARSSIARASCVLSCGLPGQDGPGVPGRCLRLIAQTLHD